MLEGKVCLIKMNVSTRDYFLGDEDINLVCLLTIGVSYENTRGSSRGKFVSIVLGSRNETQATKGFKAMVRWCLSMQNLIRSFELQSRRGHSVDDVSGSQKAFSPKFKRDLRLEQ